MQPQDIPTENVSFDIKKELAQFYTTKYAHIFQGLDIPKGSVVIEPFSGTGQLCAWAATKGFFNIESYDLDPKTTMAKKRDSILDPPDYEDKFVVTNPPFLALNKTENKEPFEKWGTNDLYKCFVLSMVEGNCAGGSIILPLNFFCDDRRTEVRDKFLSKYTVERLNIFEEIVFDDTDYTICSLQFRRSAQENDSATINAYIFPGKTNIKINLTKSNNWKVAPEVYRKVETEYKISRLTHKEVLSTDYRNKVLKPKKENKITNIFLKAVDGGSNSNRVSLSYKEVPLLAKDTDRVFATIVIEPPIPVKKQKKIIKIFNEEVEALRKKYNSLFLINFRTSTKHYARKRIGFNMAYGMIAKILKNLEEKT